MNHDFMKTFGKVLDNEIEHEKHERCFWKLVLAHNEYQLLYVLCFNVRRKCHKGKPH